MLQASVEFWSYLFHPLAVGGRELSSGKPQTPLNAHEIPFVLSTGVGRKPFIFFLGLEFSIPCFFFLRVFSCNILYKKLNVSCYFCSATSMLHTSCINLTFCWHVCFVWIPNGEMTVHAPYHDFPSQSKCSRLGFTVIAVTALWWGLGWYSQPCHHANVSLHPLICQMLISKYLISVRRLITLGKELGGSVATWCDKDAGSYATVGRLRLPSNRKHVEGMGKLMSHMVPMSLCVSLKLIMTKIATLVWGWLKDRCHIKTFSAILDVWPFITEPSTLWYSVTCGGERNLILVQWK